MRRICLCLHILFRLGETPHGPPLSLITKTHVSVSNRMRKEAREAGRKRRRIQVSALRGSVGVNDRPHCQVWSARFPVWLQLLFSQETGSCPLPAHHITSCSLSAGGRQCVLEPLPPNQKPGLINVSTRETEEVCVWYSICISGCGAPGQIRPPTVLFDGIWIWFHLHVPPNVTDRPISIFHRLLFQIWLGVAMFMESHPPALVAPVHGFKLLPQPPTEGGKERKHDTDWAIITKYVRKLNIEARYASDCL